MTWLKTVAAAGLAEAAAYFLSLSWALMLLMLLFVVTALRAQAASAKAAGTEARLNSLVVATGGVKDTADTAQSTATSAQSTANSAQTTANNALPKAGGTVTGGLQVNGTANTNQVLGGWVSSSASVAGTTAHFSSSAQADGGLVGSWSGGYGHSSGDFQADGTGYFGAVRSSEMGAVGSPSSVTINSWATAQSYCNNLKQAVDGILNRL